MKKLIYLPFLIIICIGCNSGTNARINSITGNQPTEWKLVFPNVSQNTEREFVYSLILNVDSNVVSGYYITEISRSALTGIIEGNSIILDIPSVSGDIGMMLKGTIAQGTFISGMKQLYISNTEGWTKEELKVYKEENPEDFFNASIKR